MHKFEKRITISVFISSIFLSLFLGIFSIIYTYRTDKKYYLNNAEIATSQINLFLEDTILGIKSSTFQLASSFDVNEYVEKNYVSSSLNLTLISLVNNYQAISNITLYSTNHNNNYTIPLGTGFNTYPELKEYEKNNQIKNFLNSDDLTLVSIRKTLTARYYDWVLYDQEYGILSIFHKIVKNNSLIGLVLVDLKPSTLYNKFLNYEGFRLFNESRVYLSAYDKTVLFKDNLFYSNDLSMINANSRNSSTYENHHLITSQTIFDDYQIITVTPLTTLQNRLIKTIIITLIIFVITNFVVLIIALKYESYLTKKITNLKEKISRT